MKTLIPCFMIGLVLPCLATAQRGPGASGGTIGLHPGIGHGNAFLGVSRDKDSQENTTPIWGTPFWPDSTIGGGTASWAYDAPAGLPELAAPFADPAFPPHPSDRPVHSVIHEYSWPNSDASSSATFAIVSKDGQVRFAIAIWVQNGALNFADPNGHSIRADLNTIDMESTRKLNAQAGLRWPLKAK